jgi:hypothetical protein
MLLQTVINLVSKPLSISGRVSNEDKHAEAASRVGPGSHKYSRQVSAICATNLLLLSSSNNDGPSSVVVTIDSEESKEQISNGIKHNMFSHNKST